MKLASIFTFVLGCLTGFALGKWKQSTTPLTVSSVNAAPSIQLPPTVRRVNPLASVVTPPDSHACPPPADDLVRSLADNVACFCPKPPPSDIDPMYTEERVVQWVEESLANCSPEHRPEVIVDCEFFPCMLYIEQDKPMASPSREDIYTALCAAPDQRPDMEYSPSTQSSGGQDYSVVSIRPMLMMDYVGFEMMRSSTWGK